MNNLNPSNPLNPIYYTPPPNDYETTTKTVSEIMAMKNFDVIAPMSSFGEAIEAFRVPLLLFGAVFMMGMLLLFLQHVRGILEGTGGWGRSRYSTPEPKPKRIKKPKPENKGPIYESDDGKGYWVKGYDDEITYVPRTALYPEGTDMRELEELKERNAENGQGRKTK